MVEQTLEIKENEKGYKNINLKPKPLKGIAGIEPGNYIIVRKLFAEGNEVNGKFGLSYSCKAEYKDEEVSFWLNEKEHNIYKDIGGVEDLVKIRLEKESFTNRSTGVEMLYNKLYFELVE